MLQRGGATAVVTVVLTLCWTAAVLMPGADAGAGSPGPGPTVEVAEPRRDEPAVDLDGRLIEAARAGDLDGVRSLLARGARVDARGGGGATALVAAAYGNHVDVAGVLIEAGADVNTEDETEQSAYLIATSEVGDDPRLLSLTLANGADVRATDRYNGTGLIRAADRGHIRIVERLLDSEVDVDHVNKLGWTALAEAIILGGGDRRHTDVVRLLVDTGADVNRPDGQGVTPLAHARRLGFDEIATILERAAARA